MHPAKGRVTKMLTARRFYPRPVWARAAIALGLALLYVVAFKPLLAGAGPVGAVLIALPVGMAGLYFGIPVGIASGFTAILLNTILLTVFTQEPWSTWLVTGWPWEVLIIIAGAASGLLKQDWDERKRVETWRPSYERFPAWIHTTTENILGTKLIEDTYAYLLAQMANLFTADYAHLTRWDAIQKQAQLVAATHTNGLSIPSSSLEPGISKVTTAALQERRIQLIPGDAQLEEAIPLPARRKSPLQVRSALCIPLMVGEYEFGAITVAFKNARLFTRQELTYAELAGNQIALALRASEQEHKAEKRLKEANLLANIERALSETEQVGLETVLQLIADSTRELIPAAEHAILHLLDDEQHVLVPRAVSGFTDEPRAKLNMQPGEGVAGIVFATREVIAIPDVRADPRLFLRKEPFRFRSLVVAPIQSNERCVGTISIQSAQPNAFVPDESRLLGALGTQAAIAIANAHLLETTQQNLKEINALFHISQSLVSSLDPDQLMKDVVELLHKDFAFYHAQIYQLDPNRNDLIAVQGSGEIGAQLRERGYRQPVGIGIVGHSAETGKPFTTNDVEKVVFFVRNPLLPDTLSEMTIPIKMEGRVLGVLDIQQAFPNRLSARQMQLMEVVADQLAVALQKANLYAELEGSLRQEKAMRRQLIQSERLALVGRLLASVSHELNNPIQAIQNALFLIKEEENLSEQGRQDLEIVLSESERMTALINRLRATYRPTHSEDFQEIQINTIIEDVHALTATHMRHKEIQFEFQADPKLPIVSGIPEQLRQVTLNLFMNAIEAMQTGGRLAVRTEKLPREKKVLLTFSDNGAGIDPQLLPHIFEPFVTNKENGTGLGLTITYDIIHQHHGEIQVENNPHQGATFKVWLPVK
jgi:signal transduction histidine kinase